MIDRTEIEARVMRLSALGEDLPKRSYSHTGDDHFLYPEHKAYLKVIQATEAGVEAGRVALGSGAGAARGW